MTVVLVIIWLHSSGAPVMLEQTMPDLESCRAQRSLIRLDFAMSKVWTRLQWIECTVRVGI